MLHVPVLLKEVIEVIMPIDGGRYFDGTMGEGGHARAILDRSSPDGHLAGTDLDSASISRLTENLKDYGERVHLFNKNFKDIDAVCLMLGWDNLDGILLDLGMSSAALDDPLRGFSFSLDGPLDMRFSPNAVTDARDVVNEYDEQRLVHILKTYGEERFAKRIARRVIDSRPINTTSELARIISSAIPRRFWPAKIHPATKSFQAIRMEVNGEVSSIEEFLPKAASLLKPGGVMAVISYHSIEDRIVKRFLSGNPESKVFPRRLPDELPGKGPVLSRLSNKPITPSDQEILDNPRSRSAHLRAARRVS